MKPFTFLSQTLRYQTPIFPYFKETCLSSKLLQLSGFINLSSKGIYSINPNMFRSLKKLENMLVAEAENLGGQQIILPSIGARHIWDKSGRWNAFGSQLFKLKDRLLNEYCLQPTHEEEVTRFVSSLNLSYKDLPILLFQVTTKFRDEIYPKYGLIRGREFIMKDLYTFDHDHNHALVTYEKVKKCYSNLLEQLDLPYMIAQADAGHIGGHLSHEFQIPMELGEDDVLVCNKCRTSFNAELKAQEKLLICEDKNCPNSFEEKKGIEVAHCFLLGERYSKCFGAKYRSPTGDKFLYMGCYGFGVTRLLAVAVEYYSRAAFQEKSDSKLQIRWPTMIAPYSGAIALQKKSSKDALTSDEFKGLMDEVTPFELKLSGDILVDDRDNISLGRKVLDLEHMGIPWIMIAKAQMMGEYELVDVYNRRSCRATLDQIKSVFSEPTLNKSSSLPAWQYNPRVTGND